MPHWILQCTMCTPLIMLNHPSGTTAASALLSEFPSLPSGAERKRQRRGQASRVTYTVCGASTGVSLASDASAIQLLATADNVSIASGVGFPRHSAIPLSDFIQALECCRQRVDHSCLLLSYGATHAVLVAQNGCATENHLRPGVRVRRMIKVSFASQVM